jgi:glycosyltransferase involved in cell wall biosynthesis
LIVFEALNELKKEIPEIQLICTGDFSAYESEDHVLGIKNYLEENDLKSNIKILGVINFNDVQILLKNALSVINPSLFEGWSTTVEECKILDKHIILSNIPVHIEQNPKRSEYFDPKNKIELISILKKRWSDHEKDYKVINSNVLNKSLSKLTKEFGEKYASIIKDTYNG